LNKKILDFGDLMEKLIAENQKMKIKLEEYEKKDLYFKRQMHEVSKVSSLSKTRFEMTSSIRSIVRSKS
jgi:hypothetical protein